MNQLNIIGNMTADPALRQANTANGPVSVLGFTIAVNGRKNGQQETTYFNCTAWRQAAETIAKYTHKGSKMLVTGPVSVRIYTTRDNRTGANLEVQVESFEFLSSRQEDGQHAASAYTAPAQASATTDQQSGYSVVDSDELPF